jgi:hypothetical protein
MRPVWLPEIRRFACERPSSRFGRGEGAAAPANPELSRAINVALHIKLRCIAQK